MWIREYGSEFIPALKYHYVQKRIQKQKIRKYAWIGTDKIPVHRESLFDGKCSILLPDTLIDMEVTDEIVGYRSLQSPQIVKAGSNGNAVLTFSLIPKAEAGMEAMDDSDRLEKLCQDMKKKWKQDVYYGTGEVQAGGLKVPWMGLKSFCEKGNIYSFIFLFDINGDIVLGNFYCHFQHYAIWKPVSPKLLATLESK